VGTNISGEITVTIHETVIETFGQFGYIRGNRENFRDQEMAIRAIDRIDEGSLGCSKGTVTLRSNKYYNRKQGCL
jgi:hypothetical protein